MKEALFDKNGELLDYINVYVNGKRPYPELLDKPVKDGDNILLTMPMVGGGEKSGLLPTVIINSIISLVFGIITLAGGIYLCTRCILV